jgi:hypothetical protein
LANFPLNNAYQYHQQPPLPVDLANVVYGDQKNTEALVVADASWYLVAKVPATSNKCYFEHVHSVVFSNVYSFINFQSTH